MLVPSHWAQVLIYSALLVSSSEQVLCMLEPRAVLAGNALKINLMSKVTALQAHEIHDSSARKAFKHVLTLRHRHNPFANRLTLDSTRVIYIIYIHGQNSGNFKSYIGQTSGSCLTRFAEHLTAGTNFKHRPQRSGRQEGQGLYQFMHAYGMMNLAIMPLELIDYPCDIDLNRTEFLNIAKPHEDFWAKTFDSHHYGWNVVSTTPTDPNAAMAAHLAATRRSRSSRMTSRRMQSRARSQVSGLTRTSTLQTAAASALALEQTSAQDNAAAVCDDLPMFEEEPVHHAMAFTSVDGTHRHSHIDFNIHTHVSQVNPLHSASDPWVLCNVQHDNLYRSLAVAESFLKYNNRPKAHK